MAGEAIPPRPSFFGADMTTDLEALAQEVLDALEKTASEKDDRINRETKKGALITGGVVAGGSAAYDTANAARFSGKRGLAKMKALANEARKHQASTRRAIDAGSFSDTFKHSLNAGISRGKAKALSGYIRTSGAEKAGRIAGGALAAGVLGAGVGALISRHHAKKNKAKNS